MQVKDLIKKLQEFDGDAHVEIDFEYRDSDEGDCSDSFNVLKFTPSENKSDKFLTIEDGEE